MMKLGSFEVYDKDNPEHNDSTKYKLYPGDVLTHTILALNSLPTDASDELLMGTLLHDIGKPACFRIAERIRFDGHDQKGAEIAEVILKRMKFSNDFVDRVVALVANHMKFMFVKKMRTSRLYRFMRQPFFEEHLNLHKADCLSSHEDLENYDFLIEKIKDVPPEKIHPVRLITGNDLIQMSLVPGPLFREILTNVEDQQLEGVIKTREEALAYVSEFLARK